jgi:hypothetical protein
MQNHVIPNPITSCYVISPYDKSHNIMKCLVTSRQVTPYHEMLGHTMSNHIMSYAVMSQQLTSCPSQSYHMKSCNTMSHYAMSCHIMQCHVTYCHVMPHHVMSHHAMSYIFILVTRTKSLAYRYRLPVRQNHASSTRYSTSDTESPA